MRKTWAMILWLGVFGMLGACGDDTVNAPPDPADATSCADLADKYVEITSDMIDQIGDRTDADMESPPAEVEAAANEWFATYSELVPRIGELCDEGEFDELLCDRESAIEPAGEAAERFFRDNYPACTQGSVEETTIPSGG